MPVITTDVLVPGVRRDDVLDWLSSTKNHDRFLQASFDEVTRVDEKTWELTVRMVPRPRVLGYRFDKVDDSHGGRRVLCTTTGKRTAGKLHFSLRTMRPSTDTLVTLHMDYDTGGPIGMILDAVVLREAMEARWKLLLESLSLLIAEDQAG